MMGMTNALGKGTLFSLIALAATTLACDSDSSSMTSAGSSFSTSETGGETGTTTGCELVEIAAENMIADL